MFVHSGFEFVKIVGLEKIEVGMNRRSQREALKEIIRFLVPISTVRK